MSYLIRRLGHGILELFGVSILAFALLELAPGDYLDDLKASPEISTAAINRWREDFGLNESPVTRYLRWSASVLRGDFGQSMAYGMPVSRLLWHRAGNTILLSCSALTISWCFAVPLGILCSARPRGWIDRLTGGAASTLLSLPDLLGGLIVLAVSVYWNLGAISGKLLPAALALAALSFPPVFRHTRTGMRQVLAMQFIEQLRACGVSETRILWHHALPVAANPLITLLGLSLAGLTSASLIIEVTLSWPGLGPLLLESILARDVAVVLAAILLSSLLLILGNLTADLLLFALDPRIRKEGR